MIDEKSRRLKGGSRNSLPIRLADGQEWFFPLPWVEVRPRIVDGQPTIGWASTTHGPEFDDAIDAVKDAETNASLIVAVMTIGAFLLRKNYDLSDSELEDLFVFRFRDAAMEDASRQMVLDIWAVVTGRTGDQSFRDGSG